MAGNLHGDPGGKGQTTGGQSAKAKVRKKKKKKGSQQQTSQPASARSHDEPVAPCRWVLEVTVISKAIICGKDIAVRIAGEGKRFTKDESSTRMVDRLSAAVVKFEGEGQQNLTVTASAPGWRLVAEKPVTVQNGKREEIELEIEPLVRISIRHEDGKPAKQFLLVPNTRTFKAVLEPPQEGGKYVWSTPGGVAHQDKPSNDTVEVKDSDGQTGDAEIEVSWEKGELNARARHKFQIVGLRIRHEDGKGDPKPYLLRPNLRKYKAVLDPGVGGADLQWDQKGELYTATASGATVTVKSPEGKTGPTKVGVTCNLEGQQARAEHKFTVVVLSVKDPDGKASPTRRVLKEKNRSYTAVTFPPLNEGKYHWSPGGNHLSIEKDKNLTAKVEVKGVEATDEAPLKVKYTLDDQSDEKEVKIQVIDVKVPELAGMSIKGKKHTVVTIKAEGAPDENGHGWTLGSGDIASIESGANKPEVKVKGTKAGAVEVTLKYTLDDKQSKECKSTVFFVDERIKSLKPEKEDAKAIAEGATDSQKTVEVLLGIANDPDIWDIGKVDAEAEGRPARLEVTAEDGAHKWTPPPKGLVRAAAKQPEDHGIDQSKLLLQALPKSGNSGPPEDPGYLVEEVRVQYKLHDVSAQDYFKAKVHRFGCSKTTWQRKGKAGDRPVDERDRLLICRHWNGTKQWEGRSNFTPPPAGEGVDILKSGGHQHVGRCFVCSGISNEHTTASPRTVWHWIPVTDAVLDEARGLARAVRNFALDYDYEDDTYGRFFSNPLWDSLRPKEQGSDDRGYASKMLGVLRGKTGSDDDTWLYALSGDWPATEPWEEAIALNRDRQDTFRTIPNFDGTITTYKKAQGPFSQNAIQDTWGKFGRCAATALLARASVLGLRDLEMAEVWLHVRPTLPTTGYLHLHEIGSCEQCRRYLGRMLCEVGG